MWIKRNSLLIPVSVHRARAVDLFFYPVVYRGGRVLFTTEVVITTDTDQTITFDPLHDVKGTGNKGNRFTISTCALPTTSIPDMWYGRIGDSTLFVHTTTGAVLFIEDSAAMHSLHRMGYASGHTLTRAEIGKLSAVATADAQRGDLHPSNDREGRTPVTIHRPPGKAYINIGSTRPVVEITTDGGVTVTTRTVPSEPPAPPFPEDDILILDVVSPAREATLRRRTRTQCLELLRPFRPHLDEDDHIVCAAAVVDIVEVLAQPILDAGGEIQVEGTPFRSASFSASLRVVSAGEDWFDLRLMVSVDGREAEIDPERAIARTADGEMILVRDIAGLNRLRQRLRKRLNLNVDGTARITAGDLSAIEEITDLLTIGSSGIESRAAAMIRQTRERRKGWLRLAGQLDHLDRSEPPGFGTTLRPYQRYGYAWLTASLDAGLAPLLADEMGLGKTVQTLAVLQERVHSGQITSALIVAPTTTLENWRHEATVFAPAGTPYLYHGRNRSLPKEAPCLMITSYQTLRMDINLVCEVTWDIVVFDEIQMIKNALTRTYQAAKKVTATHRIALSGTPVENTSLELHAILDLLNPGILGTRAAFIRRFGIPIEAEESPEARRHLRELLRPLILRRRKDEVARDLPPRDEIPRYVTLPPAQRRIYDRIRDQYRTRVITALQSESPQKSFFLILEGLTRLRQAAVDHRLVPPATTADGTDRRSRSAASATVRAAVPAKIAALDDLVPRIVGEGHRILIFSQFVRLLSMLTTWAQERGLSYCYLDGSMNPRQRRTETERFQHPAGPPLFFISLRAGGTGINLTGADYVILMDPWWNPAVENQAIDRTHRIGQSRPVTAYRLISADTVEEKIAAVQERKRRLAADIIPDERTILSTLSTEELLDLFS